MKEKRKTLVVIKEPIKTLATKAELKTEEGEIVKPETHDLNHFLGKKYFDDYLFQNMFVYQPISVTLEWKKDNGTAYVVIWKLKGVYTSKLKALYTAFLHIIRLCGYRMRKKLDKYPLTLEGNTYLTKVANVYIIYDIDSWQKKFI